MQEPDSRLVRLDGCFNFRDLGGYATRDGRRVRWRRLYRSDALHHLSDADLRHVRDELGVRTIVDLRSSAERSGGTPASMAETRAAALATSCSSPIPASRRTTVKRRVSR